MTSLLLRFVIASGLAARRARFSLSKRRITRCSSLAWSLSSGESSARLRRFDWVFSVLSRSLFEGVSSARLRRSDWVFSVLRRAASVRSLAWSGESLSKRRF